MFFEPVEKKFELSLLPPSSGVLACPDFSAIADTLAERLCECVGVNIVSRLVHSDGEGLCHSYVLSESSLFIWPHKIVMLTCGSTPLCNALLWLIDSVDVKSIAAVTFVRKHEYQAQLQLSQFSDDSDRLIATLGGQQWQLGQAPLTMAVYRYVNPSITKINEAFFGLSMYHIDADLALAFRQQSVAGQGVAVSDSRHVLAITLCLPDLVYDDHVFSPYGYSLNGVRQQHYVSLHISPQTQMSYVSFESNLDNSEYHAAILSALIRLFKPQYWQWFGLNSEMHSHNFPAYHKVGSCSLPLEQGYTLDFSQFAMLKTQAASPEYL